MAWKKITISKFLTERKGRYKPDEAMRMNLKRIDKIDFSNKIHLSDTTETKTDMILVKKGDLVISGINAEKGAIAIYRDEEDIMATIHYSSYTYNENEIDIDYLKWFLKSETFLNTLKEQTKGGIKTELKPNRLLTLEIYLPDKKTQQQILKQLNNIEEEVLELEENIDETKEFIFKLRQSILEDAVRGILIPQSKKDKHASELLKQINLRKKKLIHDGEIKREKELPNILAEEIPFELPEGWTWCRLGELTSKIGAGSTPAGGRTVYIKSGIKFIRSQNVYDDGLYVSDVAFITEKIHEQMRGTKVLPLDLLLNITGGSIGRCCIVPNDFDEGNINQHVTIIRLVDATLRNYIHLLIQSNYFQQIIIDAQTGAGREGLPKNKLEKFLIPLPSLAEQERISKRVSELFMLVNELELLNSGSRRESEILINAILRETFQSNKIREYNENEIPISIAAEQ